MRNFDTMNRLLFVIVILLVTLVSVAIMYTFLTFGILGLIGAQIAAPLATYVALKVFKTRSITVTEGTVQVIERMGSFSRIIYPGSSLLLDPFDKTSKTIETGEQECIFDENEVLVGSAATLDFRVLLRYRIMRRMEGKKEIADDQAVYRAAYEVKDWRDATIRQAEATLRDVLGETGLRDEFIGVTNEGDAIVPRPRSQLNAKVRAALDAETQRWGVTITRCSVQITHIEPATLDRVFAVRSAMKRQQIAAIDAETDAAKRIAEYRADLAKITMQARAMQEGSAVNFVALKWIEAIQQLASDPAAKWIVPVEFMETVRQLSSSLPRLQLQPGTPGDGDGTPQPGGEGGA
jgi:regulator of protease activity HflC (stomatin/prohibitin superfamily)